MQEGITRVEASIFSNTSSIQEALPCATTTFILDALHHRKADQCRSDEHMIVQPGGQIGASGWRAAPCRQEGGPCVPLPHRQRARRHRQ